MIGRQKSTPPPKKDVCVLERVNMLDYMAQGHQVADGLKVAKSADLRKFIWDYLGAQCNHRGP